MASIRIDVWLYGALARYGENPDERVFANPQVSIPEGGALRDLLKALKMDTQERGITFINGNLSAMPGLQPDLGHPLKDGDRVAFFHLQSMWPFQYRHGVGMIAELQQAMLESTDSGLHHAYQSSKES